MFAFVKYCVMSWMHSVSLYWKLGRVSAKKVLRLEALAKVTGLCLSTLVDSGVQVSVGTSWSKEYALILVRSDSLTESTIDHMWTQSLVIGSNHLKCLYPNCSEKMSDILAKSGVTDVILTDNMKCHVSDVAESLIHNTSQIPLHGLFRHYKMQAVK
jgi:hypothetical protein